MPFVYTSRTGVGLNSGFTSVPGPGGGAAPSPVLLPDLVAGWSLTSGPQQTLDSTGVVASGPYDFVNNGGEVYGANGLTTAAIDGVSPGFDDTDGIPLDVTLPQTSWLITARCKVVSAGGVQFTGSGLIANPYSLIYLPAGIGTYQLNATIGSDNKGPLAISSATFPVNTYVVGFAWYNANDGTLNVKAGSGATVSANVTAEIGSGWLHAIADLFIFAGCDTDNFIGLCRVWIGPNAVTIAENYLSVLDNSGDGMTDAALAAYTG